MSRSFTFGEKGTSVGLFYRKYLGKIELSQQAVAWEALDLSYLLRAEYDRRLAAWVAEATTVGSIDEAQRRAAGSGKGDLRVGYRNAADLVSTCKRLGLMEDLKAGVPRTAYKGVLLVRMHGRRVFLTPSYPVEQDITVDGHGLPKGKS